MRLPDFIELFDLLGRRDDERIVMGPKRVGRNSMAHRTSVRRAAGAIEVTITEVSEVLGDPPIALAYSGDGLHPHWKLERCIGTKASAWRYWAHIGREPASFELWRRRIWRTGDVDAFLAALEGTE